MIRSSYLRELSAADWKTKLRKSLEAVSLEPADVLGKYPHQLSGGQLQRLMIARALLLDIKFLVADEIISMLDASTRIDVLNLLGDLKERGRRDPLHHARPLARQLHLRQDPDPASRPRRRDGRNREGLREARAPVHADAAGVGPPSHGAVGAGFAYTPPRTARTSDGDAAARRAGSRPFRGSPRSRMNDHVQTGPAPLTLSFMGANYVGRELGYGAADEWGPFDVATNAAFEPIETFGSRFDAMLDSGRGGRLRSAGSLARTPELALGDARAHCDRARPARPPRASCRQPRGELRCHSGRARVGLPARKRARGRPARRHG